MGTLPVQADLAAAQGGEGNFSCADVRRTERHWQQANQPALTAAVREAKTARAEKAQSFGLRGITHYLGLVLPC